MIFLVISISVERTSLPPKMSEPEKDSSAIAEEQSLTDVDDAWKFLDKHRDAVPSSSTSSSSQEGILLAIRRKNDWRIVPLGFLCYTMQFMDKLVLNYAGVMSMRADLRLTGNDFSNLVTATYIATAVWELPTVWLLQRFPVAKYMAINVILWGISTACGAAAKDYSTMMVTRVLLGIFEATINPSLMLIAGRWYTKPEQAPRLSLWLQGLGVGQIVGGALSYGFQFVSPENGGLAGWRILFITLGVATVVIGIATYLFLPDNPMEAPWLDDGEKVALLKHISVNQTGVENKKFRSAEIWEALRDPQVWLIWASVVLFAGTGGIVVAYSATLIRNLGYDPKQATLLNMPSGLISITVMAVPAWAIRRGQPRWAWALAVLLPAYVFFSFPFISPTYIFLFFFLY